jgi:thiosulfate reductase cytochrome b subunit
MSNALLCLLLIVTGLSIQYSNPGTVVKFNVAVAVHNVSGIILTFSYIIFFIGNLFTDNGVHYLIGVKGFITRMKTQIQYYTVGIFRKESCPFPATEDSKFNPLQQFSYVVAMYGLIPIMILSGWGLLYPEITINSIFGISGLDLTDLLHIGVGFLITIFMCIHIYFCTIGKTPTSNFKSMINGYHESH